MNTVIVIALVFGLIAFLYSSAGFGGGSSYLAVLTLFAVPFIETRFIALCCNVVVVLGSAIVFYRAGLIKWKKILPLVILSVPMAWLGGRIELDRHTFLILLGISLTIAGPAMILRGRNTKRNLKTSIAGNAIIGGGIGFLSGLVGIGGGIFLAPLLHLSRWDKPKVIAATASIFILLNSLAGLWGQSLNNQFSVDPTLLVSAIVAVIIGGQLGVRLSVRKLQAKHLRWVTAVLVTYVGIRILIQVF